MTLVDILRQDYRERVVLVELDYMAEDAGAPVTRTLYFSSSVRATQGRADLNAGDGSPTGAPVIYEDCLNSVPTFNRSLSGPVGSTFSSSLGSIEIDNADGDKDFMLALALDGSQARFYVWDFGIKYLVFTAIALRVSAPSFDRISVVLKDSGVLLNKSVGGTDVMGGTGPNADRWRPINFGYVHNLEALVLDAPSLTYVHSDTGTFTAAVDVRDKGVSVTYTDNTDGTFTLDASPAGIITCDVVASYDGTDPTRRVSDLLQFLVGDRLSNNQDQGFDGPGATYTIGDDDDYLIGISIPEARNIVDVLNQVCDSGNCFWAIKRTGEFTYGRLRPNNIEDFGFVAATITEDDYDQGSWKIDHDPPLYYLLQAYMSRNWYQQSDFAGSLTPDEQAVFTRPGIFLLQDTAVGSAYADIPEAYDKTLSISPALDTLLSGGFDELDLPYLAAWMETRRFMQLPWIERLSLTVGLEFYFLELGDPVEVVTPRYGLDGGDLFQVISININLTRSKIDLVLLRRHEAEPLPPGWQRVTASIEYVPPPLALKPFINPPPPGPGGVSPEPCGWLFDPRRGWYFVPCGGGGGSSPSLGITSAYAVNSGDGDVTGFDWDTETAQPPFDYFGATSTDLRYAAITDDNAFMYLPSFSEDVVYKIDLSDNTLAATIDVSGSGGSGPEHVAITPDGSRVYVSCQGSNSLSIIETSDDSVVDLPLTVVTVPAGIAFGDPGSGMCAYVACHGDGSFSQVAVIVNVEAAGTPSQFGNMDVSAQTDRKQYWGAVVVGTTLYVSAWNNVDASNSGGIDSFDITTNTWNPSTGDAEDYTIASFVGSTVGMNPREFATDGTVLYVCCNAVVASDGGFWQVLPSLQYLAQYDSIQDVTMTPSGGYLLGTAASGYVVKIDPNGSPTLISTIAVGANPIGVRTKF